MKRAMILVVVCVLASVASASVDTFGTGDNQFTIDFVDITGDASGANGTLISSGTDKFTDPANDYRIGKFEITNDQWNKFTNINGTPYRQ